MHVVRNKMTITEASTLNLHTLKKTINNLNK